jgi:hypothetical protein
MIDVNAPQFCANHPTVETSLRCNQCGKPICAKCAVRTPTGYRCKECVKGQQKIFVTAVWYDYVLGFVTAGVLSGVASGLVGLISGIAGFFAWFIMFAAASAAGVAIAEAVRFVTRKHRSRPLFLTVAAGVVLGGLPVLLFAFLTGSIFSGIFVIVYLVIATPVVYTRLSGIRLTK